MCILAIYGEPIDGVGLYEVLSKSNMSIIWIQNLLIGFHVKTTRYCIKVVASAIYLKLVEAHRMFSSDLKPIKWLEEVSKTSPISNYQKMIVALQLEVLLCFRFLPESNFQLYVLVLAHFMTWFFAMDHYNMLGDAVFIYFIC